MDRGVILCIVFLTIYFVYRYHINKHIHLEICTGGEQNPYMIINGQKRYHKSDIDGINVWLIDKFRKVKHKVFIDNQETELINYISKNRDIYKFLIVSVPETQTISVNVKNYLETYGLKYPRHTITGISYVGIYDIEYRNVVHENIGKNEENKFYNPMRMY